LPAPPAFSETLFRDGSTDFSLHAKAPQMFFRFFHIENRIVSESARAAVALPAALRPHNQKSPRIRARAAPPPARIQTVPRVITRFAVHLSK